MLKMNKLMLLVCCSLLIAGVSGVITAQEGLPGNAGTTEIRSANNLASDYSYAIGLDLGSNFRRSHTELDLQSLLAGVKDGLGGSEPKLDEQACAAALQQLQVEMQRKAMTRNQTLGEKNKRLGAEFLAKNRSREGVQVTRTGLQYLVLESGSGPVPGPSDTVRCNYRGTLIDGTVFDASERHGGPAEFPVNRVIPGWTEALQMMHVGDKWQLFIPPELAYDNNPPTPEIAPGSVLIFDIELVDIVQ